MDEAQEIKRVYLVIGLQTPQRSAIRFKVGMAQVMYLIGGQAKTVNHIFVHPNRNRLPKAVARRVQGFIEVEEEGVENHHLIIQERQIRR